MGLVLRNDSSSHILVEGEKFSRTACDEVVQDLHERFRSLATTVEVASFGDATPIFHSNATMSVQANFVLSSSPFKLGSTVKTTIATGRYHNIVLKKIVKNYA